MGIAGAKPAFPIHDVIASTASSLTLFIPIPTVFTTEYHLPAWEFRSKSYIFVNAIAGTKGASDDPLGSHVIGALKIIE
jgi:hypothetical protein